MAFLLRSTKFIHGLIGITRQRALLTTRVKTYLLKNPNAFVCNEIRERTLSSLAVKKLTDENYVEELDRSIFQLTRDMQYKNVFVENVKEVFEAIKERGNMTYSELLLLLKGCGSVTFMPSNTERIQMAEEIWKTAADLGLEFQITHYNALLNVFLENDYKFSPSEFLDMLMKDGVKPNLLTYKRILKAFCQQGDIEGANRTLEQMKTLGYPLSEEDFNALVECHCKAEDLEKATEIINLMKKKDIDPTSKTYVYILCAHAKKGDISKLRAMITELPKMDIYLSDSNILEVVYTLSVNGHAEHIEEFLGNLSNSFETVLFLERTIHRLLHDKLDSFALKIFSTMFGNASDRSMRQCRQILRHFILYRSPNEVLDMCKEFKEGGWMLFPENYILKTSFFEKDELFILDLLRAMMNRNMEVRSHYFWPALIKASKNGRLPMLEVLKEMPRNMIVDCLQTTNRIILPNFSFGEDWRSDFETLGNVGVKKFSLSRAIFKNLLANNKFSDVEEVASTLPFSRRDRLELLDSLANAFATFPNRERFFVNIMYYLAHDQIVNSYLEWEEGETSNSQLFDYAITRLINSKTVSCHLKNEEVLHVLEHMLEKKMRITKTTGDLITSSFPSQEVKDTVEKLTDPELVFNIDQDLSRRKMENFVHRNQNLKQHSLNLTSDVEANLKILRLEMEREKSFESCLGLLRSLITVEKYKEIDKLLEILEEQSKDLNNIQRGRDIFLALVFDLCRAEKMDLVEKAFNLGVRLGCLRKSDFLSVVRLLLQRCDISYAVDQYIKFLDKSEKALGSQEVLRKVVAQGDEEVLRKLTTALTKYLNQNSLTVNLCFAFAFNGQLKKARRIIESSKLKFAERQFYSHCNFIYQRSTSKELENYLTLIKDQDLFDRVPFYKLLLKKYAEEENLEGAKNLWQVIEEDDISNYSFLEQMGEFMNEPTLANLKTLVSSFEEVNYHRNLNDPTSVEKLDSNEYHETQDYHSEESTQKLKKQISELAAKGEVEEVINILNKLPMDCVRHIAVMFLKGDKPRSYVEFLEHFVKKGGYYSIRNCFNFGGAFQILLNDKQLFENYRAYAVKCFKEGNIKNSINSYFVSCLRYSTTINEAEAIFDLHYDHFKALTIDNLVEIAKSFNQMQVYENLISSKKLKSHFSKYLPVMYTKIISISLVLNNCSKAVAVLHSAMGDGVGEQISMPTILKLANKLEEEGKSFPYPELLKSTS